MTTSVESVSSAVRGYVTSVSGGVGSVPEVFDGLAQYVVGELESSETVLRVACLRNPRPDTTTAALAVLTDRAVLLAEEGAPGHRIALSEITDVRGVTVEHGGVSCPALDLFHAGGHHRIVAAVVDGGTPDRARAEMQSFLTTMTAATDRPLAQPPAAAAPQAVAPQAAPAPAPAATRREAGSSGAHVAPGAVDGKATFVRAAAPVGGIPRSRPFDAICYVVAGIALVVMSRLAGFPGGAGMAAAILIGLGAIAYGAKIMLTRTSYRVSSWVYLLALASVTALIGLLAK